MKRPFQVLETEQEEEVENLAHQLQAEIDMLREHIDRQRKRATIPGTSEHDLMQSLNQEVEAYNTSMRRQHIRSWRRRWISERLFKEEKFVRDNKKGGLDFVWYAFNVYKKYLFPYYLEVRKEFRKTDPDAVAYITEDNVGVHGKARRLLAGYIHENEILFADWPTWSPDLHSIEHLHREQKKLLLREMYTPNSASAAARKRAAATIEKVWQGAEMTAHCERWASIQGYRELGLLSKGADPPYSNRFRV